MQKMIAIMDARCSPGPHRRLAASAATVVFYAKSDNAYGWCAGVDVRGETAPRVQCEKYGNDCIKALECEAATPPRPSPRRGRGTARARASYDSAKSARPPTIFVCTPRATRFARQAKIHRRGDRSRRRRQTKRFDQGFTPRCAAPWAMTPVTRGAAAAKTRAHSGVSSLRFGPTRASQLSDDLLDRRAMRPNGTPSHRRHRDDDDRHLKAVDKIPSVTASKGRRPPLTFTRSCRGRGDADQAPSPRQLPTFNGTPRLPARSSASPTRRADLDNPTERGRLRLAVADGTRSHHARTRPHPRQHQTPPPANRRPTGPSAEPEPCSKGHSGRPEWAASSTKAAARAEAARRAHRKIPHGPTGAMRLLL